MRGQMTETLVSFGEIVYPPGGRHGPRRQTAMQLVLLYSGAMTVWVDGLARTAWPGSVCALVPGRVERFAFSATEPTHHAWVHLWPAEPEPDLERRLAAVPEPLALSRTLAAQMRELLALDGSRLPTRLELQELLARTALLQFLGEAELAGGRAVAPSDPIQRALDAIEDGLSGPLDVHSLAAAAAVSRAHLIRLFRRELNTTPAAYVWERRVARALGLLEDTGLPVGEVARRCGFASSQHFSRRTKSATGLSPAAYRSRAWERG